MRNGHLTCYEVPIPHDRTTGMFHQETFKPIYEISFFSVKQFQGVMKLYYAIENKNLSREI